MHAYRLLLLAIFGRLLGPEFVLAQVSASALVRAEVRESCPKIFKRCRPKPPKAPDDDGDDASHSAAVQSFLQNAEVITADGEVVFPSHVTLGRAPATAGSRMSPISRWWISLDPRVADPDDRSAVWWEWWGTDEEHGLEAAYSWLFGGNPQFPPVLSRTPGVTTIVAEY